MKFEYETSFVPVTYEKEEEGVWIFKTEGIPVSPNIESVLKNQRYYEHLREMGDDGWELISVQPLLRGIYKYQKDNHSGFGLGYSLTAGYYFFWKRTKS